MKKCNKCKSKNIISIEGKFFCHSCSKTKQIFDEISKNNKQKSYNKKLEEEQKINTNKSYLRFRVFIVGEI